MYYKSEQGLKDDALRQAVRESLAGRDLKKVLILPPDYSRMYSGCGKLTAFYYELLKDTCEVDVMPALGTHVAMTREECEAFFEGVVPYEKLIVHNWRHDVVKIGEIPSDYVSEVSEGLFNETIDVEVNHLLIDGGYDLILSLGQVVPHEVVGMSSYSKNIFVGCGGFSIINSSHLLGAFYGMERIMGKDHSPVRKIFDYAQQHFMNDVPLLFVMTCATHTGHTTNIHGLYIGETRECFEMAVKHSQEKNMTHVDEPFDKVIAYLDPREFKSTWIGNKAVYRTCMAIRDGGELIILAPGIERFGEDDEFDRLIRKYGYVGRENVLKLYNDPANTDLKTNLSVVAHLIKGSSTGRFKITYCTKLLSKEEMEGMGLSYRPYDEMAEIYNPALLKDGWNDVNGERVFYISNPAIGLWTKD